MPEVKVVLLLIFLNQILVSSCETFVCPEGKSCFPKCCAIDDYFDRTVGRCVNDTTNAVVGNGTDLIDVDVYRLLTNGTGLPTIEKIEGPSPEPIPRFGFYLRSNVCNGSVRFLQPSVAKFHFLSDGRLFFESGDVVKIFGQGFCLEKSKLASGPRLVQTAFICAKAEPEQTFESPNCYDEFDYNSFLKNIRCSYTVLGSLSQIFLGLTFYLYLALPELRNFQGKLTAINIFLIFVTTFLLLIVFNVSTQSYQDEFFLQISYPGEVKVLDLQIQISSIKPLGPVVRMQFGDLGKLGHFRSLTKV